MILSALACDRAELSIFITDDREIQKLNHTWRGIEKPTDVLAFSQQEGQGPNLFPDLLGDVVISIETAKRQAIENGHDIDRELDLLLVHGILHLLGYDHEQDAKQARRMLNKQSQILKIMQNTATE